MIESVSEALPPILSAAGWAEALECSQKTIEERMRAGDLPGEKFGDGWVCTREAMLARVNEIVVEKMLARRAAANDASTPAAPRLVSVGGKEPRTPPRLPL